MFEGSEPMEGRNANTKTRIISAIAGRMDVLRTGMRAATARKRATVHQLHRSVLHEMRVFHGPRRCHNDHKMPFLFAEAISEAIYRKPQISTLHVSSRRRSPIDRAAAGGDRWTLKFFAPAVLLVGAWPVLLFTRFFKALLQM